LNVGGYGLFPDFYNMPDNHGALTVDLIDTDFNVEMVTSSGAKDKRSLFNVSNGTFKNIVRINLKGNKFYDKINAMTFNHSLASAGSDRFILTLNDNDFGGILNIDY